MTDLAVLFEPLRIGPVTARSRVMLPPHTSAIGNLWGTEDEARVNLAYFRERAEAGVAWATIPGRVGNVLAPGFEPSGVSAETRGIFRHPSYHERVSRFSATMHDAGALAASQLTMIGGFPHAPSARLSSPVSHQAPHVLTVSEITTLVEEYAWSAKMAREAGVDIIELHMNHDDLHQWFVSPLTNHRDDEYGGDEVRRLRFASEVLTAVRTRIGAGCALGVRMNAYEHDARGYDRDGGLRIAERLQALGVLDFVHIVVGTPWGNPSYIQPHFFEPAAWSTDAQAYRTTLDLPIVYTGLVSSPSRAAEVIADGHADAVGMARAHVADGRLLMKAKDKREHDIRPCVGVNDCINRRYVDRLPFGCAVNPHAGREVEGRWPLRRTSSPVLVVGAGPAGMEVSALVAEAGAPVTLVERTGQLGGQLRVAARAPSFGRYQEYVDWQARRLHGLDVDVRLGVDVTMEQLASVDPATRIVIATGADERVPDITRSEGARVHRSRDLLEGRIEPGGRVAVVVQDDHMAPLALAEALACAGRAVVMFCSTQTPAPLLGRYIAGSVLGRLDQLGVRFRLLEEVTEIGTDHLTVRHVYSGRTEQVGGFDDIVFACGGVSNAELTTAPTTAGATYVVGDAYAPRRLVWATRQALAVAELLTGVKTDGTSVHRRTTLDDSNRGTGHDLPVEDTA